ncbi:MAG: hypothetical protein ACYS0G_06800 [Planctomycetota bacterium]|jgi:hypothetical protein
MHRTSVFFTAVLILVAGGCSANPIRAWQASLEEYVVTEGNGDPNILRSEDRPPSESDFGLIGAKGGGLPFISPRRTDANGVLLGLRNARDRDWYVYLVGTVEYRGSFVDFPLDDPRVTDIRLIAFSIRGGEFAWGVGEPHEAAVEQYCRPQLETWRRSHPSRAGATQAPTSFPTRKDVFRLEVAPLLMVAIDEHSQARWMLQLPPPPGADAAADSNGR